MKQTFLSNLGKSINQTFLSILEKINRSLHSYLRNKKKDQLNNKFKFHKLTPIDSEDISLYQEAIDFAFDNTDIQNIAISGAYGSGKSSLLKSYKSSNPDRSFIHISLTCFNVTRSNIKDNNNESVIEGKILNQLIHQIPAKKIPQTNFRVKKGINKLYIICYSICLCLFIASFFFILFHENIVTYTNKLPSGEIKEWINILSHPYYVLVAYVIVTINILYLIYSAILVLKTKNIFRKISLNGNEIEIFEEQDDSYFDKYLNEVLYLFDNLEYDAVVFEDIDRFNAGKIFERLREVNTLINLNRRNRDKENYTPLKFFYLIRDDIFNSKERTKFFDFLIPVVPVMDSSNSYEQFIKHFEEGGIIKKFDLSSLQGLSLYIDDMRLLKNIYNEFIIYFDRLNVTKLNSDKMLAIITYKNIYPCDFSLLQLKKGVVYNVFSQQKSLIDTLNSSLLEKQTNLRERIKQSDKEIANDIEELDVLHKYEMDKFINSHRSRDEAFYIKNKAINKKYELRKQAVKDREPQNKTKLKQQLDELPKKISQITNNKIKDLLTRENVNDIFSKITATDEQKKEYSNGINDNEHLALLKYLIRSGLIDETYTDYMTYFYEGGISINDKIFLRRITDKHGAEYTYPLKEPKKILESPLLNENDFEEIEVLNFDLFNYLLENISVPKYSNYIEVLITQLKTSNNFDFASKYYAQHTQNITFIKNINEFWNDYFSIACEELSLTESQLKQFSIDALYHCDSKLIEAVNSNKKLSEYISSNKDFLKIDSPKIEKLITGFKLINVSFKDIDYGSSHKELFAAVYKESLYALSFSNIKVILENVYKAINPNEIIHKNYTLIHGDETSSLMAYVNANICEYLDIILKNCEDEISDDLSVVLSLLNNKELKIELKTAYITLLTTKILYLKEVLDIKLWSQLIANKTTVTSYENIFSYFNKFGMAEELINFINSSTSLSDFSNLQYEFDEVLKERFSMYVLSTDKIEDKIYIKILQDLKFQCNDCKNIKISIYKWLLLIINKILKTNETNLLSTSHSHYKHLYKKDKESLNKYFNLQADDVYNLSDAVRLLTQDSISSDVKSI